MNQLFGQWIGTQPPEKWGLDEASVDLITRHYQLREIVDNMDLHFWSTLDMNRDTYINMLRLQLSNKSLDPMVNRYFEAMLTKDGTASVTGAAGVKRKSDMTTSGHSATTGTEDTSSTKDTTGKNTQTRDLTSSETKTDSGTSGTQKTRNLTEGHTFGESRDTFEDYNETTRKEGSETRGTEYNSTFTTSRSGEILTEETSTPTGKKTTKDTHLVDTTTTTTREGSHTQTRDDLQSDRSAQAAKSAPMSAVNLPRQTSGGTDSAYDKVRTGSLGDLDFSYASQYGETDAQRGLTSKIKDEYAGQQDIVVTEGKKDANVDTREESWSADFQDKTSGKTQFNNYSNSQRRTGSDTETTSFEGRQDVKTMDGAKVYQKGAEDVTFGGSENADVTESRSGKTDGKEGGTVTDDATGQETVSGNLTKDISVDDSGTSSGTESSDSTTSTQTTDNTVTKNRYTGREGLTPQEGLASALQYLADYPNALMWLFSKLDRCFIAVYDI